ncbi:MAG: ECF transporter S component, partial [Niameybacter sp.]
DIYSLYFAPVQITTGLLAGWMFQKGWLKGKRMPIGVLLFTLPTSLISAIIAAAVFGGVTSSGSSYIVQVLSVVGVPTVVSVFIVQVLTDYVDKYIAVLLVLTTIKLLPHPMKKSQDRSL